ncbi:MAG: gamma-glutamyl-gamma-aminobutyrate hydrolase family protein [Bacillota bacterium]|nr:gamma-glutamyl-gamma-aminobutyrate hydrolase family protein [Bacillota bacterium]
MKKPIIGLTCNFDDNHQYYSDSGVGTYGQKWSVIPNDYSDAIIRAGGIPFVIPISEDQAYIKDIADLIDGLLLTGGADLDPLLAKQRPNSKIGKVSPERDRQELMLLDYIYKETKKPILGVCRGLQMLNVYLKGNLILDIPSAGYLDHSINCNYSWNVSHQVEIKKDSLLYEILGQEELMVNSYHHQAAKDLGQGLKIGAMSEDGIIEALEDQNARQRFLLAVQWHPEMLAQKDSDHLKIFKYFVDTCKK